MKILNDLNLKKQADDLGVTVWQTPSFLFIALGLITGVIMAATYFISVNYDRPEILALSECMVVAVIFSIGTSIIRLVDQMARLNKMKSEFVSVASHQLRTPISAIRWETEILLTKLEKGLDHEQIRHVENISELSNRMTRLVNDLLDVARIEQNRLILRKRNFNLAQVAQEAVKEVVDGRNLRHVKVTLTSDNGLPDAFGDPDKIKLAIDNLVSNAVKYTTSGGRVDVKIYKKKADIIFEVKDNGVGIPAEQTGRVFEKFFRSDNAAKYQTEGTGLGLYISKNIVEQLGGKIWFQSIENVGSLFGFSVPGAREIQNIKNN